MKNRLVVAVPAVALAVALLGVAPAEPVFAQDSSGGTINIGGSIADTVAGAVSGIVSGSDSVEHTEASFGEEEGVAIADASGGNRNLSAKNK